MKKAIIRILLLLLLFQIMPICTVVTHSQPTMMMSYIQGLYMSTAMVFTGIIIAVIAITSSYLQS